jgi:circadian clock protein KaiC
VKSPKNNSPKHQRLTSGVEGLEDLTSGGFVKGGLYLLIGPPGSGKTILGNQICFHHANDGGSVVYVTLLAESHSRMIGNLKSIEYFKDNFVARSVHYVSGYNALEKDGLKGLLLLIAGMVREKKASLLMIDGITTIGDMDESALAFRKFTHELNTYIATLGCTAFLLSSLEGHHSSPEHTMVDGILALHHTPIGVRTMRQIEVRKFRGSDHLEGKHYFSITNRGIKIIPRLESMKIEAPGDNFSEKIRSCFGVHGLDTMLGGGVIPGSITTVIGSAGTGKTILGLHFLNCGAINNEKGLFFGMYESPQEIIHKAKNLQLPLAKQVKDKKIEIMWHPSIEQEIDGLGNALIEAVIRTKAKRVVIDGVDAFRHSTNYTDRLSRYMVALVMKLRTLGTTVLLIEETSLFRASHDRQIAELSALNENLILLEHSQSGQQLIRNVSILKIRNSIYDSTIREMLIDGKGISVMAPPNNNETSAAVKSKVTARNKKK